MSTTRRDFLQGSLALAALYGVAPPSLLAENATRDELWYDQPARRWLEALPIGNGRVGGMIFGGIEQERIALSESTAWSGAPAADEVNPGALEHLPEIRRLFFAGEYARAQELCQKYLLAHAKSFGTNLPLPELQLSFDDSADSTQYRRSLSLDEALARVQFRHGDALFSREVFASHPAGVIAVRLTSTAKAALSFRAAFGAINIPAAVAIESGNTLVLRGHAFEHKHSNGQEGVAVQIRARIFAEGGQIVPDAQTLRVQNAHAVTVLIAVATDYRGRDPEQTCRTDLDRAAGSSFAQLRSAHMADHRSLYRRVSLNLGESSQQVRSQPTDARRKALASGVDDPELVALFFQYGRYLTIAGSREDSPLPLALQGIWNDGLASSMGWTDDYHLDINTQQNYWAAEVCNLAECQTPIFGLINGLREAGRTTARQMYGAPGWVCHTVTNPWGYTAPGGGSGWGVFVTAGVWISQQIWDHYAFNPDADFLRTRVYPVLRDAAHFFVAYMIPEPKHGWLVTGPSDSPENWYIAPSGAHCAESMGPTVDRVFVYALYSMCIEASTVLGIDADLRTQLVTARSKLVPFQIGRYGQLQEWLEDFEEAIPNHRHTSHLTSLYPENQISPRKTPELARAAEVTIERRLNAPHWEQSEWGRANLVVYYARLLKGAAAHKALLGLIADAADDNLLTFSSAGVAGADSNIFALDGNTAGSAGLAEMLLQSQGGEMELLPALPAAWPEGSVRGLCARGGFVVDVVWQGGELRSTRIASRRGGSMPVRYRDQVIQLHLRPGGAAHLNLEDFRSSKLSMESDGPVDNGVNDFWTITTKMEEK